METADLNGVPFDVLADARAIIEGAGSGKPLDPEMVRRVQGESAKITEQIRRRHGTVDLGVDILRELRGGGMVGSL